MVDLVTAMKKFRKRKMKKPRNLTVLVMLVSCKGGAMKDRRAERGGAHNQHRDLLEDVDVSEHRVQG